MLVFVAARRTRFKTTAAKGQGEAAAPRTSVGVRPRPATETERKARRFAVGAYTAAVDEIRN